MAVLEIVLLAGPAFAVGARRSRRQLGLVGTCGGDRRHVRAVVLSGGLVLGGAGAVVGVVTGLVLTVVFRPLIEDQAGHRFGSLALHPKELLAIAVIGLVTGLLAAFAPAIVAKPAVRAGIAHRAPRGPSQLPGPADRGRLRPGPRHRDRRPRRHHRQLRQGRHAAR